MRQLLFMAWCLLLISASRPLSAEEPANDADYAAEIAERDRLASDAQKRHTTNTMAREQKNLRFVRNFFGPDGPELIANWDCIAELAESIEDWESAGKARGEALRIATVAYGKTDWRTTDARLASEDLQRQKAFSADERRELHKAAEVAPKVVDLYSAGRFAEALEVAKAVLQVRERLLGPEHLDTARAVNNLAMVYESLGKLHEAEPLFDRVLKVEKKALGIEHPRTATGLNNVAGLYYRQGRYAAAQLLFEQAFQIREKILGSEHTDTAASLNNLARLYCRQGKYAAAEPLYTRALRINEKALGPDHPDTATSLYNLAGLYEEKGDYKSAEPLFKRALAIRENKLGREHPDTAASLNELAMLYESQGNFAAAEPLLRRALAVNEKVLGPDHPDTATNLINLVALYRHKGDYRAAQPLSDRAVAICENALSSEHPKTLEALNNRALLYDELGDYAAAEKIYQRVLRIRENVLGPEHRDTAGALANLGTAHFHEGNYAKSEPLFRRALDIEEAVLGAEHPHVATTLNNLASLYKAQGDFRAAEPLLQRSLIITEKALGAEHPSTAFRLNNLASLYDQQGNYAAAEPLYQRALKIFDNSVGREHPHTATSLNNLAFLYDAQGNYAAAEPLYRQSLLITEKVLGPEHPDTALRLNNLASVSRQQGNLAAAERLYKRALKIFETSLGQEHPRTATTLNNLARLYERQGNTAAAESLYQQALKIFEDVSGREHSDTAIALTNLGFLKWQTGHSKAARELAASGLSIQLGQLQRTAAVQTEEQQLLMARKVVYHLNAWLTITSADREAADEAWKYALKWKGLTTTRQVCLRHLLKDDSTYTEYRRLGQQLSTLILSPPAPPADPKALVGWNARAPELRRRWQEKKETLEAEWERLGKDLSQKSAAFREANQASAATPTTVRSHLALAANTTALVDLIEYRYYGRAHERWEWRIAAFVVRTDRDVQRIELGASGPIKERVAEWRERFGRGGSADESGTELRRLLWQPIAAQLEGIETVLISPDGVLAQLPWGALPGEKPDTYLIEDRALAVIPTPQLLPELLARQRSGRPPRTMLVAGDIDYGADAGASDHLLADARAAGRTRDGKLLSFGPLEAAQAELASIERRYRKKVRDGESDTLEGPEATEAAFRDQAGRHEWLHIITHGFFAPETIKSALEAARGAPRTPGPNDSASAPKAAGIHPGLLSGLAFAGANSPPQEGKDDGILTALEVSALDLSQVDTVVLSACETGLGEVAGGEGLLGLQRAFQVAGAKTVVASLWKVPDRATSTLMQRFYENLWDKKMGKLAALREAQIWMMRDKGNRGLALGDEAPDPNAPLPPYFWAAFVLSGDWR